MNSLGEAPRCGREKPQSGPPLLSGPPAGPQLSSRPQMLAAKSVPGIARGGDRLPTSPSTGRPNREIGDAEPTGPRIASLPCPFVCWRAQVWAPGEAPRSWCSAGGTSAAGLRRACCLGPPGQGHHPALARGRFVFNLEKYRALEQTGWPNNCPNVFFPSVPIFCFAAAAPEGASVRLGRDPLGVCAPPFPRRICWVGDEGWNRTANLPPRGAKANCLDAWVSGATGKDPCPAETHRGVSGFKEQNRGFSDRGHCAGRGFSSPITRAGARRRGKLGLVGRPFAGRGAPLASWCCLASNQDSRAKHLSAGHAAPPTRDRMAAACAGRRRPAPLRPAGLSTKLVCRPVVAAGFFPYAPFSIHSEEHRRPRRSLRRPLLGQPQARGNPRSSAGFPWRSVYGRP